MTSSERSFRVEAVVLRHRDFGEADRMLTLFTRQRGKLQALAKGARKPRSRKAGHLEPFTRVTLQLARGREMLILTQADTLEAFLPIKDDLLRTGRAAYLVELIDRFLVADEAGDAALYELLVDSLRRIADQADPWLAIRYYEVRMLDLLGFRPQLFACANCGGKVQAVDQYFSPLAGGVLCPACGRGLPGAWEISVDALRHFRHFQRSSYAQASRAHPAAAVREELERLLQRYFTYLLERELNSPGFLKQVQSP